MKIKMKLAEAWWDIRLYAICPKCLAELDYVWDYIEGDERRRIGQLEDNVEFVCRSCGETFKANILD